MQFRKVPYLYRRIYSRRLIVLILSTTFIVAVTLQSAVLKSIKKGTMPQSVSFDEIPVDENGVLRFAAVDTATGEKISVEDWIRLVSDPKSSDLTQKMVIILKVSKFVIRGIERAILPFFLVNNCSFPCAILDTATPGGTI